MPTCLRTQQLSYLISTNQCHEPSILHKFMMMPHREMPRHQEDCFTSQKLSAVVNANLEPEGSATPDAVLPSSVNEIWAPRHDQGEIGPGGPTLCDHRTPYLPNLVRERSTAILLVPTGHRPAASNDSDSFTSKKEGLHSLEKSSDLKNHTYQWFCFFLKV